MPVFSHTSGTQSPQLQVGDNTNTRDSSTDTVGLYLAALDTFSLPRPKYQMPTRGCGALGAGRFEPGSHTGAMPTDGQSRCPAWGRAWGYVSPLTSEVAKGRVSTPDV